MLIRMNLFAYLKIIFEKNPNYASSSAGFSWFKRMQKAEDFENFVVFGQMNFEDFVFFCRKNFEERKQITIFAQEK